MDDVVSHLRNDDERLEARAAHGAGDPYLAHLGTRVRSMRAVRGMSRKTLSRASGVSERYIAQLEGGAGNLSITLLRRLAGSMGVPVEDLVADGSAEPHDWTLLREQLRNASPETLERVRAVLAGASAKTSTPLPSRERIALIGMRGAGKSTLGRRAAAKLGWPFIEINEEIERDSGLAIAEVFSLYGQDGYRRLEAAALGRVIERPGPIIVATGGGIVADPLTFERLLASFHTIWIRANPVQHMGRVRAQGDTRPMGRDRAAMTELETILASRLSLYSRARETVDTSSASVDESLDRLLAAIAGSPSDDMRIDPLRRSGHGENTKRRAGGMT